MDAFIDALVCDAKHNDRLTEAGPGPVDVTVARSVLLVDDDVAVRETLADLLELEDCCVYQAADAAQALMLLLQEPAAIDVLITDLSMPGADGIELIKRARQVRPNLPAILLTGYAEEANSVSMATGGGFQIMKKPVQSSNLLEQIAALLP